MLQFPAARQLQVITLWASRKLSFAAVLARAALARVMPIHRDKAGKLCWVASWNLPSWRPNRHGTRAAQALHRQRAMDGKPRKMALIVGACIMTWRRQQKMSRPATPRHATPSAMTVLLVVFIQMSRTTMLRQLPTIHKKCNMPSHVKWGRVSFFSFLDFLFMRPHAGPK